jgi:hypothetical protein
MVIKADQFPDWHKKFGDQDLGVLDAFKGLANIRSTDTVPGMGRKAPASTPPRRLVEPAGVHDAERRRPSQLRQPSKVPPVGVQSPRAARHPSHAPSTPRAAPRTLVCAHCGEKISFAEGKFCWNNERRFGGLQYCREHQNLCSSKPLPTRTHDGTSPPTNKPSPAWPSTSARAGPARTRSACCWRCWIWRGRGLAGQPHRLFGPPLLERYHRFFDAVKQPGDHANPYFPFFHLAGKLRGGGASFWHLVPLPGRESVLAAMSTARSVRDITDNIAWAELDPDLFALLQHPEALDALGQTLASHWFDRGLARAGRDRRAERRQQPLRIRACATMPSGRPRPASRPRVGARPGVSPRGDRGLRLALRRHRAAHACCRPASRWLRPRTSTPSAKRATTTRATGWRSPPNMHWALRQEPDCPGRGLEVARQPGAGRAHP